jgi:hypothetical protein
MYYVMGYIDGEIEFMTRKPFLFLEAAKEYADENYAYKAFIVQAI